MIKNKFITTSRSISFNFKNNTLKKNRIKHPYIWFLTDNKKTKCPLKILEKLPKKSGVIIRDYNNNKIINNEINKWRSRRLLTIIKAGKYSKTLYSDGVHYPQWLQSSLIKRNAIKSMSVHSGKDIRKSINIRANLVFISPVFETTSHKNRKELGIIKLGLLVKLFKIPVIALGGINNDNVSRLRGLPISGCAGIDVFSEN
jgi:Thiamine monophosphate synthase